MGNYRERINKKLHACRFQLNKHCKKVFRSYKKKSLACNECKKALKDLNKNVERWYNMMKEPKVEKMDWKNPTEGIMTVIEEREVTNGDEVVGTNKNEIVVKATIEDIEKGMQTASDRLTKNKLELNKIETDLVILGNVTSLTVDQKTLKDDLDAISAFMQCEQLRKKQDPLKESVEMDELFLKNRQKILDGRPKK